ncbi:50S ribosomal protein L25 [Candidatus Parcubacteria bacterium]|nr:50S ribosomal protein L25 [Candidatus Parcubacteria bacterium]
MLTLKAELRDRTQKPEGLRKAGKIPAVFYGKKTQATSISISETEFEKVWKKAGESTVVEIKTPESSLESLIHEVDFDPISGKPRHADFYVFEKGHKVSVEVPIEFEGVSSAVKDLGGTLVKVMHALKVEAMPKDLPYNIVIDISPLVSFESQILAKDIKIPEGVTLLEKPEEVVALVSAPREEKEEESAPIDLTAIEVEKKGKEETEEAPVTEVAA